MTLERFIEQDFMVERADTPIEVTDERLMEADGHWLNLIKSVTTFSAGGCGEVAVGEDRYLEFDGLFLCGRDDLYSLPKALDEYEDRLPERCIPVGCDQNDNVFCMKVGGEDDGTVYFWRHDADGPEQDPSLLLKVAESFDGFLSNLYMPPDQLIDEMRPGYSATGRRHAEL